MVELAISVTDVKSNVSEVSVSLDEYSDAIIISDVVIESCTLVVFGVVMESYAVESASDPIGESQILVSLNVIVGSPVSSLCNVIVEFQLLTDV